MAQLDLLSHPVSPVYIPAPHTTLPQKADNAYKTISEVAEEIDVPAHVLRFWESHFPQVKPSRMRGSRRYYRPEDVELLKIIKTLLYNKGYTIKGAKKVVRSGTYQHDEAAAALSPAVPLPVKALQQQAVSAAPVFSVAAEMIPVIPAEALRAGPSQSAWKHVDVKAVLGELRMLKTMLADVL